MIFEILWISFSKSVQTLLIDMNVVEVIVTSAIFVNSFGFISCFLMSISLRNFVPIDIAMVCNCCTAVSIVMTRVLVQSE